MTDYSPTAWSKHCSVGCLQGSYDQLGWTGPGRYRQAIADAVAECAHQVYVGTTARPVKTPSVLDVACFTGEYYGRLQQLCAFPWSYQGVDVTPEYVEAARARFPQACFNEGSAMALSAKDRSFDVVLCAGLLIHVDDPAAVIRECARVGREWLIIGATVNPLQKADVVTSETEPFIVRTYSPGYISDLCREVGTITNPPTAVYGDQGVWVVKL